MNRSIYTHGILDDIREMPIRGGTRLFKVTYMNKSLPVELVIAPTANGETCECYFRVHGEDVKGRTGVGAWAKNPTPAEAFKAAFNRLVRDYLSELEG